MSKSKQIVILFICVYFNGLSSGMYNAKLGRFMQRDPIGTSPRVVHSEQGPKMVGTQGPIVSHLFGSATLQERANYNELNNTGEQGQYIDGMNLYEYVSSNPINYVDPWGLNIYLITGNNSGKWLNDKIHQKVCVGCSKDNIKACFSFGRKEENYWGWAVPSTSWLGWSSLNSGGPQRGVIYEDDYTGGSIKGTKITTFEQDATWLQYMSLRVGMEDTYSVGRHNCRKYSQMEFADAP
jgi:hypothetical protein